MIAPEHQRRPGEAKLGAVPEAKATRGRPRDAVLGDIAVAREREQQPGRIAAVMAHRPDLVKLEAAGSQSGENQRRLTNIPGLYTGIWWYAAYPNHYAGDGSMFSRELGETLLDTDAAQLAELIRYLKKDNSIKELQEEFYRRSSDPLLK